MSLQYLIDGYNLLHSPYFQYPPGNNKDSRVALLEFIRARKLTGSSKNKVTVVFDGYCGELSPERERLGMGVIFSGDESADDRIKKEVERALNRKVLVVVSDDREIGFFARQAGARHLGLEGFAGVKKKQGKGCSGNEGATSELSYSQKHKIDEEMKKMWLN